MALLTDPSWTSSSIHPILSEDEVHVWRASLSQPTADHVKLLSRDEQMRAERFRFEQARRRFVVGRGILRIILGRYLDASPENLEFKYGTSGKPTLLASLLQSELCFNLSHSEEMMLLAVTQTHAVGIDLEYIRPDLDVEKLTEQFFSPSEKAELDALPLDKKLRSFFSGWTRKEAYLKARGDGMVFPWDQFSVSMDCERAPRLLEVKDNPRELKRWSLQALTPAPGYIGALAVEGHNWKLKQWHFGGFKVQTPASSKLFYV
jgi:4'-phosphopantetheinyl transferase